MLKTIPTQSVGHNINLAHKSQVVDFQGNILARKPLFLRVFGQKSGVTSLFYRVGQAFPGRILAPSGESGRFNAKAKLGSALLAQETGL